MFWTSSLIFIHIPRTGGTVLTDHFGKLPQVSKDVHTRKHARASHAKILLRKYWDNAEKIAIYRPNEEIALSWYNHIQRYAQFRTAEDRRECADGWWDMVSVCKDMTFEQFCACRFIPTVEHYVDLPGINVLSFKDATERIATILRQPIPNFSRRIATSADPYLIRTKDT